MKDMPEVSLAEAALLILFKTSEETGAEVQADPKLLKSLIKKGYVSPVPKHERDQDSFAA